MRNTFLLVVSKRVSMPIKQRLPKTAVERVQARIKERLAAEERPKGSKRTQKALARVLGISSASISEMLNGPASKQGLLHHLDAIADYLGVPTSLLVSRAQSTIAELRKHEPKMLAHIRSLPDHVQLDLLSVLEHFCGLLPEEREARYWWSRIRRIKRAEDRERLDRVLDDVLLGQRPGPSKDGHAAVQQSSDATQKPIAPVLRKDVSGR